MFRCAVVMFATLLTTAHVAQAPPARPAPAEVPGLKAATYLVRYGGYGGSHWSCILHPDGRLEESRSDRAEDAFGLSSYFWGSWWHNPRTGLLHIWQTSDGDN